ncbi:RNA-binding protein [Ramlibacter sp. 2FC]|uniref:RNA-binding protein n=1 Tax=Ramlibacter sp. 2FC TaxID=2502188 RepID=UPI0010F95094|nr:RNA-binding protein [Ramlibacter sp. 2FC]
MKPFELTSSMLTLRGVFYPTGYLFVMLPSIEAAEKLDRDLQASGFNGDEPMLVTPEAILGEIRHTVRDDANIFPSVGTENATVLRYEELARQGHCAVMIHVRSEKETQHVMDVVHKSPFSYAERYRHLVIEDMS